MKLLDVLTAPWAIEPGKLLEIQAIYATHMRGDKIDLAAVEKKLGRPLDNQQKAYDVIDGVAVLQLDGVIAKRMNMFSQISGGVSTEMLVRDLNAANADTAVHSIILAIDSPGGTVDGTQTLATAVANSIKPIISLASGTMASAAYWIGSAANSIYITDSTTNVGSIGVVATHTDVSAAEASKGVKTTEIAAGKYKRIASSYEPLTKEGRQSIQDQVDYTYGLFVDAVARHRGVSADVVLKNMADGRIFIGQQAIDAGLVDGVSTLDALVQQLNETRAGARPSVPVRAGVALPKPILKPTQGAAMLTAEQVAADHPQAAAALVAQGASAERARIQSIEAQAMPGHGDLINALKFDGKSTAGDAAMAIVAAEKSSRTAAASALATDAPAPLALAPAASVTPSAPVASDKPKTRQQLDADTKAYMAAHPGTDYVAAFKLVQGA
jgi:signal peptide peptidase SppA